MIQNSETLHLPPGAPAVPQMYVPLGIGDEVFSESFPSHPNCLQYKITLGQQLMRIRDSQLQSGQDKRTLYSPSNILSV